MQASKGPVSATDGTGQWTQLLQDLVLVPQQYAASAIAYHNAATFLGCDQDAVEALVAAGLPRYAEGFDRFDLLNIALAARTGRSLPEIGLKHVLKFVRTGSPREWSSATTWLVRVDATCSARADEDSQNDERWLVWEPSAQDPIDTRRVRPSPIAVWGRTARLSWELSTEGSHSTIRSSNICEIVDSYLDYGLRFARMPNRVQVDSNWMQSHGIFDCLSCSTDLSNQFRKAKIQSRVRQGWLAARVASPHAWIEVVDADGEWKTIDLALRALAEILFPASTAFSAYCLGSRLNRLVATSCPPNEELVEHVCSSGETMHQFDVSIQSLARQALPRVGTE